MLTLYSANEKPTYPLAVAPEHYCITHVYNGQDLLSFEIDTTNEYYPYISNEVRIKTNENRYVIRSIDEQGNTATIDCQLDLDDWHEKVFKEYKKTQMYLSQVLDQIKPTGWTYSGAGAVSARRTVEKEDCNSFDLLAETAKVYDVAFNFDALNKRLSVIVPSAITATHEYITEELNLKKLSFKGLSTDLITRIYPYGKDDLNITSVNGGVEYVEDLTYSPHVVSAIWKDDRYTVASNLKTAALEKLKESAHPICSYECEVADLAKSNPEYDFLTFWLYRVVTLIDNKRKTRVNHRVVEYKEYPLCPEQNVVTLSSVTPQIENTVKELQKEISDSAEQSKSYMEDAIKHNNEMILGNTGGTFLWGMNAQNQPETLYVVDTQKLSTAKNLWIWNKSGIGISNNGLSGPIKSAWTIDGKFNADCITFGTLKGSLIEANSITARHIKTSEMQIGWNNISAYTKINYNGLSIYNSSETLLMRLDYGGQNFYDKGRYLGKIGVSGWNNQPEHVKGLAFRLAYGGGNYMTWSKQENPDSNYIVYLTYHDGTIAKDGLHLGRPLYCGGRQVKTRDDNIYAALTQWGGGAGIEFDHKFSVVCTNNSSTRFESDSSYNHCYQPLNMHGWNIINQSDARLKTNINSVSNDILTAMNQISVESYDWITDNRHVAAGIITDKLQLVFPELVTRDNNDVLSVNYIGLIPYLIKSIQELSDKIGVESPKLRMASIQQENHYEWLEKLDLVNRLQQQTVAVPFEPEDIIIPSERTQHEQNNKRN